MKAKDIKVGHIYYVDFEPTRKGEFGRHHMGLVLKRTVNQITFITVPLTGNSDTSNKIKLDIKDLLPEHLRTKDTYAVYDQIRTVNSSRFSNLVEDGKIVDVVVPDAVFDEVLKAIIANLTSDLSADRQAALIERLQN